MATQKQLRANRANATKSTGPRTPEGKSVSRRNAFTHGAYAERSTLLEEEREAYDNFKKTIVEELAPVGFLESQATEEIAWCYWRIDGNRTEQKVLIALAEANRRDKLFRDRMNRRWWQASRSEPSSSSDAEIAQHCALQEEIKVLESMTTPANPEIERRRESCAAGETQLQRKLQNALTLFFALRDRREGRP
jgi:hypothetical protein